MFRLQRFYNLQFSIAFLSNGQIFMYVTPSFSMETHFYLSYNVIIQLQMVQKELWTLFPTVPFPKAFSSNHPFPRAFLWHRLFMMICSLFSLYSFSISIPSPNIFFFFCRESLPGDKNFGFCTTASGGKKQDHLLISWRFRLHKDVFSKENSLRHGVGV